MQLMFWSSREHVRSLRIFLVILFALNLTERSSCQTSVESACYDKNGIAKTCLTYPKNVALNREVVATDTCGTPSEVSCQIGANTDRCRTCNASDPKNSHPARNMVDFHNPVNITWWQSTTWWQTNLQGRSTLADPPKVNVTLSFKKLYLVSGGVRVTFYTVRPKKMVIQRSTDDGKSWSTYQYYAKNCQSSYGLPADPTITTSSRFAATCTQRFSSELPYVGGVVVFDPRLARYQYAEYQNPDVQGYLSATNIRLLLEYPGTDGRENINNIATLNQYYYAISDIVVDARCACYGHAQYCDFRNGTEVCDCKHFTTGKDCQICLPLYNNRTWMPGNATDANECQKCQCYDHASSCIFDQRLGFGVCQDCQHNTTGSNCENCIEKFYRNISRPLNHTNVCIPCDCFRSGITDNGSCAQSAGIARQLGQCNCKPGVYGRRCDQCVPGKWGFSTPPIGTCFDCICNIFGTFGSNETCDPYTGQCRCKSNVQSMTCSECKDTFHSFPTNTSADCQPCGCHIAGGFPICNKATGDCPCRRGIIGRQCTLVRQGFYFPNFTHVNFEVEMMSQGRQQDYFWMLKGYRSVYMGIGQIKLNPGQSITYTFQVPVTHRYSMVLRYSLFPINWLNSLFLYDAETLSWSGSDLVSAYTTSADNPFSWNITIAIFDSANSLLNSSHLSVASLYVGEAKIWNDSSVIQLRQGLNYRMTFTYDAISNAGIPWPIIIDSVVLLPDLTNNLYYTVQSEAVKSEVLNCHTQSASLSTTFGLPSVCRQHIFGASVIIYNGSLACDCYTPGSNNPASCEQYGGQCNCKPGYGGRRCDHCLAGYYGNPSTGCIACECSSMGSLTPVCNQTDGNCFCKSNVQGSKCNQCKTGTFSLAASNPDGCQSCYGFGHSLSCTSAKRFITSTIASNFTMNRNDGWLLITNDGTVISSGLSQTSNGLQYIDEGSHIRFLSAPSKFLGNQLNSYGQRFLIQMDIISLSTPVKPKDWHLRLIGGGSSAVFSLFPRISTTNSSYYVYLHEKFMVNDTKLSEFDFKSLLGQLTGIHLSLNLLQSGSAVTIQNIEMTSSNFTSSTTSSYVSHVENATCQIGYEGLSCERCAKGYTRAVPNGGPLVNCVPCNCNGRSMDCHPQSGICSNCRTGTTGNQCERCMPNLLLPNCTTCMPGFWKISPTGCEPCNCYLPGTVNGNSKSCDLVTGQCFCNSTMNVAGRQCNQCKQNAYNISLGELQCKQCPPCYIPIEQDYIQVRHQSDLLQREISSIWSNPSFVPKVPLDQSVATLTVIINSLTSHARASLPNVTALNTQWVSLQTEANSLQNALTSNTSVAVSSAVSTVTQLLSSYNQSYASIVAISSNVVSSYTQLTTFVSNIVLQQDAAVRQLGVLRNNTSVYLATTQSFLSQANSLKSTATTRVSQSIRIASLAANNSQNYQTIVRSLNSSMMSLRNVAVAAQRQGNEVYALAAEMKSNASAVSVYATQLQGNITAALPDHSQTITTISATTTSLRNELTSLDNMITAATRDNNGVEQQISVLKQTNSILNSQISTTERRLDAVKATVSSASSTSSAAISSAVNTEREAVSMLNIVNNFQSVSQRAAIDASNALTQIDTVLSTVYSASNITANISSRITPLQAKVNQVSELTTEANQIAITEQQAVGVLHNEAIKLRNNATSALDVIQSLNIQQYIDNSVSPLLSRCRNYTSASKLLAENSRTALTQSQLSYTSAQMMSITTVNLAVSIANIPSIDQSKLTPIYDNLLRVRQAYAVLGITGDLANLQTAIERIKVTTLNFRTKINTLKEEINAYKIMYNSLETLTCNVPSQIP